MALGLSDDGLSGSLLIASAALETTEFARSVVYVCQHSSDEGALGVIVNCALPDPAVDDVRRQLDLSRSTLKRDIGLGLGGPVDRSRGFILHSGEWREAGAPHASGADTEESVACLSADMAVLHEIKQGRGPKKAMMLLGHAAWEPGQLEDEIIHGNAWFVGRASEGMVFGRHFATKWTQGLNELGIDPLGLSAFTGEA